MKRFIKGDSGQALVELALVLPVLILLLLMIMEGGRIFASYLELQHAARDGARYAAIKSNEDKTVLESTTRTHVKDRLTLLDPNKFDDPNNFKFDKDIDGTVVSVRLNYPVEIFTPIISTLTGETVNLQVYMVMRGEGG